MKKKTVSKTNMLELPEPKKATSDRIKFTDLTRLKQSKLEELIEEKGTLFIVGKLLVLKVTKAELG